MARLDEGWTGPRPEGRRKRECQAQPGGLPRVWSPMLFLVTSEYNLELPWWQRSVFQGKWLTIPGVRIALMRSDNELITQVQSQSISPPLWTTCKLSSKWELWDHSKLLGKRKGGGSVSVGYTDKQFISIKARWTHILPADAFNQAPSRTVTSNVERMCWHVLFSSRSSRVNKIPLPRLMIGHLIVLMITISVAFSVSCGAAETSRSRLDPLLPLMSSI